MSISVEQLKPRTGVVRGLSLLSNWAIWHPKSALVLAALLTLAATPGILRLKLRTDGHALVSPSAPEVIYDQAIREQFGIKDQIVVLIRSSHPEGIFNAGTLQLVRELTADFAQFPGMDPAGVMSLATEPSFRLHPRTYAIQTLLAPALTNKAELDQLRNDLRRIELYTGTLVSADGKCTAILIGAPSGVDRARLYQKIQDTISTKQSVVDDIAVTGAPVAESLLGIHLLEDLGVPTHLLGASTRAPTKATDRKPPSNYHELRTLIVRRMGLVPVAMVVMMAVFFLSFRNVLAMLLPLPEVAMTLLFVFGLMGWCGVPIYLTIAVMPVLLTAMCVTDEIHVFSRYFSLLREEPGVSHIELVRKTVDELVSPVVKTTLTTAVGFVSFAFSPLPPVQAFGIFTAVGVLFSLFYSLTVVPAMLTLLPSDWLVRNRKTALPLIKARSGVWFARGALAILRHRAWVVGGVLLLLALAPLGLRQLVIQDSWIDGFDPDSEFRRATQIVNDEFHGMHLLLVCFDAPKVVMGEVAASAVDSRGIVVPTNYVESLVLVEGSSITVSVADDSPNWGATNRLQHAVWQAQIEHVFQRGDRLHAQLGPKAAPAEFLQRLGMAGRAHFEIALHTHLMPEILRTTSDLASFIRQRRQYAVGGVLGPADYLQTTRFMAGPNRSEARRLPVSAEETKLLWHYYEGARGLPRLREAVDTNYWRSLTTVFLKDANFVDTAKLMRDIRAYEREHLTSQGIKLGFAGDVAVSQSLIKGIVTTQMQSLFWSLVGIYLVTAVLGRSLRWGVYCVLPSTLAVVINFAVMGWFGIPLGVATSMFAGMTLGIGVDFAIHMLAGYELARARGLTSGEALSRSMAQTGPAVLINTLAVSLGFGVLMFSQVPANARLGLLTVLGLVDCLIATLLILPVLLHWWPLTEARATKAASLSDPA